MRGPSLLEDQSSRLILKAFRDRAIFAGICQHGDLPFNRKDHPWFFVELGASYFDQLQLIALSMPAILRRYMVLAGSEEPTREDHEQLVTDTYTILADFRSWYARLPELMLPVNGCDSSACGRMLQWYRLCEIICMVVLNRSLSFLSSTASHSDGQERHKVERALISSETRESLKALGMAFQILPRPNGVTPAQDRMAALERFAGSKCL